MSWSELGLDRMLRLAVAVVKHHCIVNSSVVLNWLARSIWQFVVIYFNNWRVSTGERIAVTVLSVVALFQWEIRKYVRILHCSEMQAAECKQWKGEIEFGRTWKVCVKVLRVYSQRWRINATPSCPAHLC